MTIPHVSTIQALSIKDGIGILCILILVGASILLACQYTKSGLAMFLTVVIFCIIYPAGALFMHNATILLFEGPLQPFAKETHIGIEHVFRKHHKEIKAEVLKALQDHDSELGESLPKGLEINGVSGRWTFDSVRRGNKLPSSEWFPLLTELVRHDPNIVHCSISRVGPRAVIGAHYGYSRSVYRLLYPIKVPRDKKNVHLTVQSQRRTFEEGVPVVFDDNLMHSVRNDTDEDRVAIYVDIARPIKNPLLAVATKGIIQATNWFFEIKNRA